MKDNLIFILHLAAQGKLDRLDMQIMCLQSGQADISYGELACLLARPRSTIQMRVKKIRTLLQAEISRDS